MSAERDYSIQLLRGTIGNLQCRRRQQDFVLNEAEHAYLQATAAGAALAGMGASAIGLIQSSANSEEEADWVEFELDGKPVQGWLWKMPMRNGDEVEAVAEQRPDGRYFAYSIRRPRDNMLAVYPHATRGRSALFGWLTKIMLVTWAVCSGIVSLFMFRDHAGVDSATHTIVMASAWAMALLVFGILFYRAYLKMRRFARLAELIFAGYGWPGVRNIDLVRASKQDRPDKRDADYGVNHFRYRSGGGA
ncbi:putative type VI secretion system effector [Burkholderia sp. Ac-20379]|uniref:putative type VI secretion system effector n=1 Tax=Burkholderia sp. Ac-20379 TaxID=2703900 RepID=UPI001981338D|nr:putative type VI secretion system effector [Burkholderia sp. Ac-20379]MBN3725186.1 hypothetical protein [Burkholderia sp. Ac-20379]